jgi:c-di-GMP-binding flagellar brake protein YcgR
MEDSKRHNRRCRSSERAVRLPKRPDASDPERRDNARFQVTLDLRYRLVIGNQLMEVGRGRTVDISSSGLRFTADRPLAIGRKIELSVAWPVALPGSTRLQLWVSGEVVRSDDFETAVKFIRYEFRTLGPPTSSALSLTN